MICPRPLIPVAVFSTQPDPGAIKRLRSRILVESVKMNARELPLELVERQAILSAIEHTQGDRGQAATLLGIGRTTLYRKLKEYGLAV